MNKFVSIYQSLTGRQKLLNRIFFVVIINFFLVSVFSVIEGNISLAKNNFDIIENLEVEDNVIFSNDAISMLDLEVKNKEKESILKKRELIKLELEERKLEKQKVREKELERQNIIRRFKMDKYNQDDYNNLVRIVEAEVGDNDVYGKKIVANVVLNRVKSEKFPNNITDVIFQKRQFSPIADGRYYKVKISKTSIEAVNLALLGEDNSEGALYFMDRRYASKKNIRWFDAKLKYLFYYGGHEYFK